MKKTIAFLITCLLLTWLFLVPSNVTDSPIGIETVAEGDTTTLLEVETVEVGDTIVTMSNFLRIETHKYGWEDPSWYDAAQEVSIYVVSDKGSQITVSAKPEYPYYDGNEVGNGRYALYTAGLREWNEERSFFEILEADKRVAMSGSLSFEVHPLGDAPVTLTRETGVYVLCESDYARLSPAREGIQAQYWAEVDIEDLYYNGLLANVIDPFEESCEETMTWRMFLPLVINLYERMSGEKAASQEVPFTDLEAMNAYQVEALHKAYGLGLLNGIFDTNFSPDEALTMEQAIAIFGRLASQLGYTIPEPAEDNMPWTDAGELHSWAKAEAAFLDQKSILPWWPWRTDGLLRPQEPISIQHVLRIAYRFKETPYWPTLKSGSISEISFDALDVTQSPGIGLNIVFESPGQIILYGEFGLFGYDLERECLTFGIDFLKAFGRAGSTQGESGTGVEVSQDGTEILLTDPAIETAYHIDLSSMTFQTGGPQMMETTYQRECVTGEIISSYNIETCRYTRDGKDWFIFR